MRVNVPDRAVAGAEPKHAFEVLILYENFLAGKRAMDTCGILVAQLGGDVKFRTSMWKFEILHSAKLSQIAAMEALAADMIIVAMAGNSDLPGEIRRWIDSWVEGKRGQTAALVALLDRGLDDTADFPRASAFLQEAASRAGIDFFAEGAAPAPVAPPSLPEPPRRRQRFARTDEVIGRPGPEAWGLND